MSTTTAARVECRTEYTTVWNTEYQEREVQECDTKWVLECKTVFETNCRNTIKEVVRTKFICHKDMYAMYE